MIKEFLKIQTICIIIAISLSISYAFLEFGFYKLRVSFFGDLIGFYRENLGFKTKTMNFVINGANNNYYNEVNKNVISVITETGSIIFSPGILILDFFFCIFYLKLLNTKNIFKLPVNTKH